MDGFRTPGSTPAGMIAGFAAFERTREQVARIARHTAGLVERGRDLGDDEITLRYAHLGGQPAIDADHAMWGPT